jgi:hypothetical protein
MNFFGAFTLLVLPLFLFVCTQMIKQSSKGKTMAAKIVIWFFYFMSALCLGMAVYLLIHI